MAHGEVKKEIHGAKYVDIVESINHYIPDGGDDWIDVFTFTFKLIK